VTEQMSWFEAVVLGIVQGLTEFLPISSSAHILIVSQLFGWRDPGAAFTAVSQIGTETAVLLYFRKDLKRILVAWFTSVRLRQRPQSLDARMGWYILIGTLPIAILGLTFANQIETAARNLYLVAFTLIGFGVVLGVADRLGKKTKSLDQLRIRDGLLFGFGQALALIPGVSRSGATISTGLFLGYNREAATRYAFLLAIPAVLASGLYEATKIGNGVNVAWGQTIVATVIAFIIGYAVIAWLLRWVTTHSYTPFVIYRIALGSLVLILLASGVLSATAP
jgi:undecaprenyl-diphosphatase